MITPRWVKTRTQPIAVDDVVRYLVGVLGHPDAKGRVFEVGGPEVLRYSDMLQRVARLEGDRSRSCRSRCSAPASSRWLALVTDVDTQAGRNLVDSMTNEVIVQDDSIRGVVPFEPMSYDDAVRAALAERRADRAAGSKALIRCVGGPGAAVPDAHADHHVVPIVHHETDDVVRRAVVSSPASPCSGRGCSGRPCRPARVKESTAPP